MSDICNNLKVIPQFVGSCWFNAFLMIILYSENARNVLIRISKKWDKNDKFLNILKNILKKNYSDPSIAHYYNKVQPQLILFKFLKKYNPEMELFLKEKIKKNINDFGWSTLFFVKFLKFLKINCLDIIYNHNNNDFIINFDKTHNLFYKDNLKINFKYNDINIKDDTEEINNIIKDIPEFLILYHTQINNEINIMTNNYDLLKKKNKQYADIFNLSSYNIDFDKNAIQNYSDIIIFNGIKYKLDSCILNNYNTGNIKHAIAGITCKNNRYVYNGWTKKTFDPAFTGNIDIFDNYPCSLMKHNWNLKKDKSFCLNLKKCNLDFDIKSYKNLCFSFSKGKRILIYVRIYDDDNINSLTTLSSNKEKLSDFYDLIKDIYQIDNINLNILKKHLKFFGIIDFKGKSKKDLQELLFKKILENYDIISKKKILLEDIKNSSLNIKDKKYDNKLFSRKNVYKQYKFLKHFDTYFKDIKLLKQQYFLTNYITDNYSTIDKMLLFHGIGTGKTCSAITIVETIMNLHINMKALIILPARLKTNFIDELISETCGFNKYISKEEYNIYTNPITIKKEKDKIRKSFMNRISQNYEILSYESLRNLLINTNDIKDTINRITYNKIVIIDEIHNLITSKIDSKIISKILNDNKIPKNITKINGIILRLMTSLAHKSSKFFLLTATPVFDNYGQFIELVLNLCPDINEKDIKRNIGDLNFLIDKIRGKVSFYKLKDLSSYPKTIIDNILIPLSKTQDDMIFYIKDNKDNKDEKSNMFCITERQLSISVFSLKDKDKIFSNLIEYAPKLNKLFELIHLDGKHVIYSNFINYCLYLIAEYLKKNGWNDYIKDGIKNYKTFVIWDASLNDDNKQNVKNILNSINNIDGKNIKIILGSPSIKEGISFKHIQHLHQIDPVWNSSAKSQVEGRCIRYKSHDDISLNDKKLKREVIIHNYISISRKDGLVDNTCDSKIYFDIIKKKAKVISIIEKLLMKVSIDYYLWVDEQSPTSDSSKFSLTKEKEELENILQNKKIKEQRKFKIINNCPKNRRPDDNNQCFKSDYPFIKINNKGFPCCYKKNNNKSKKIINKDLKK